MPVRILHKVAFSGDGTPGPSRSLVINRAPGEIKGEDLRARRRCALPAFSIRPRWRSRPLTPQARSCAPTPPLRASPRPRLKADATKETAVDLRPGRGARPRRPERIDRGRGPGQGRDRAPRRIARGRRDGAFSPSVRLCGRSERRRGRERHHLRPRHHYEQRTCKRTWCEGQKMQAIGQLAGGIAHDFNNVLTAIIGYSDLLLANHRPTDPSFQDIMQIKQNANRGGGAGAAIARLFAPSDFAAPQTLQAQRRIVGIADAAAPAAGRRDDPTRRRLRARLAVERVKADLNQFEQVIVNLVVNARDAIRDEAVRSPCAHTRNFPAAELRGVEGGGGRPSRLRSGRGRGHRSRHSALGPDQELRTVLHHQGRRQRHRPWLVDGLRHHQADGGVCVLRERAGRQGATFRILLPRSPRR